MEIMGFTLADVDQKMLMNFVREDEIAQIGNQLGERFSVSNATDLIDEFSTDMFPNVEKLLEQARNFGRFRLQAFDSQAELDAYIADERIGVSDDFDAVCFAFSVHENEAKNKYELELMYNDMWPGWLRAIPN